MPFNRPTLSTLRAQAAADIASAIPGADAQLRFSNLNVLAAVLAEMGFSQYGYLDWIAKQAVPFTATDEYLEGWAALKGIFRKPATKSAGQVTFPGVNGTVLPAGSEVIRSDGVTYSTTANATVASGTVVATIQATLADAGGNASVSTAMTLAVAVAGIQSSGTVTATLTGGADPETNDALRNRMLEQYQAPPQGGDQTDYIEWALAVPGVTRAWCTPNGMGIGTVVVYTMLDLSEAAHNGFPQGTDGVAASEPRATAATGDQLTVANAIYTLQPVTALVYAVAPVSHAINFTISGISTASAATKAAIAAAIAGVFLLNGAPGGTIDLSDIEAAIAAIPATEGFVITTPSANITNATGQLPVRGTVTYT